MQTTLLVPCDIDTGKPLLAGPFAENMVDKTSVKDLLDPFVCTGKLFIAEKLVYFPENLGVLTSNGNLIPSPFQRCSVNRGKLQGKTGPGSSSTRI